MSFIWPYSIEYVAANHFCACDIDTLADGKMAKRWALEPTFSTVHYTFCTVRCVKAKWKLNCFSVCNLMREIQFFFLSVAVVVAFKLTEISCRFSHSLFVVIFVWRRLVSNQYQSVCGALNWTHVSYVVGVCRTKNVNKSNWAFLRLHFWTWTQLNINWVSG